MKSCLLVNGPLMFDSNNILVAKRLAHLLEEDGMRNEQPGLKMLVKGWFSLFMLAS